MATHNNNEDAPADPSRPQRRASWDTFLHVVTSLKLIESLPRENGQMARNDVDETQEQPSSGPSRRTSALELEPEPPRGEGAELLGNAGGRRLTESAIDEMEDDYELPASTFSLLTTEDPTSLPFATGVVTAALMTFCLVLALTNELDNAKPGNPFGTRFAGQCGYRSGSSDSACLLFFDTSPEFRWWRAMTGTIQVSPPECGRKSTWLNIVVSRLIPFLVILLSFHVMTSLPLLPPQMIFCFIPTLILIGVVIGEIVRVCRAVDSCG